MLLARLYLILTGIILAAYGAYCIYDPNVVANLSGLVIPVATASIEIMAMYGGLQLALGIYFILCIRSTHAAKEGLLCMGICFLVIALTRGGGLLMHIDNSDYNRYALIYEVCSALVAFFLLYTLRSAPRVSG